MKKLFLSFIFATALANASVCCQIEELPPDDGYANGTVFYQYIGDVLYEYECCFVNSVPVVGNPPVVIPPDVPGMPAMPVEQPSPVAEGNTLLYVAISLLILGGLKKV